MMKTLTRLIVITAIGGSLLGCSTVSNEGIGTVGGAIAGGVAGSAISGGNAAATVGGAVVGGFVGNQIGRSMDESNYYYNRGYYDTGYYYY